MVQGVWLLFTVAGQTALAFICRNSHIHTVGVVFHNLEICHTLKKKKSFFKTTLCSFSYTENPLLVLSKCILLMYIWYIHSSMYCTVCNSEEKQCPLLPAWLSLCSRPQIETLLQVLLQFTVWRLALCVCGLSAFCSGQPLGWVAGPLE